MEFSGKGLAQRGEGKVWEDVVALGSSGRNSFEAELLKSCTKLDRQMA